MYLVRQVMETDETIELLFNNGHLKVGNRKYIFLGDTNLQQYLFRRSDKKRVKVYVEVLPVIFIGRHQKQKGS